MASTINKNIEIALENIEAGEEDKQIIKSILFKERLNKEYNWDSDAPKEIQSILRENETDEEIEL
ncbi:hypothetical protein IKT18_03735 [Candidatus Saccharibacteria bacterium]|nr:hypothetical protein [Candidatus Saccharibacteria bacterium]